MTALVTENNDLKIQNNNFVFSETYSDQEVEQRLMQNLQFFLGEWFLNTALGIPYLQLVFIKGVSPLLIESAFKRAILDTDGVSSLSEFSPIEYDIPTRAITLNFVIKTVNNNLLPVRFRP